MALLRKCCRCPVECLFSPADAPRLIFFGGRREGDRIARRRAEVRRGQGWGRRRVEGGVREMRELSGTTGVRRIRSKEVEELLPSPRTLLAFRSHLLAVQTLFFFSGPFSSFFLPRVSV